MKRLLLVFLVTLALSAAAYAQKPLEIYFVDAEGGAATLIVTPAGESVLVDSGWQTADARDARRILAAAKQAGLNHIDYLVTTHFHRDHFGGAGELAKLIPIEKFYDHGRVTELADDPENFPKLNAAYLRVSKQHSQALHPGDEIHLARAAGTAPIWMNVLASNRAVLRPPTRLASNPECQDAPLKEEDPSDNANSVGMLLAFGKFRFLDLGDLTWNIEHKLVCPANVIGKVTLYQVTHHGMNVSNNPALLRSVQPQVAVMNNGPRKGGSPDVVKWLRQTPGLQDLYQLHRNVASRDNENAAPEFIANLGPGEGCTGALIKVSVAPDGNSYSVTNSRTGQSRSYTVRN